MYLVIILAFEKSKIYVSFKISLISTSGIIKSLNVNKAKGPDGISAKFVKMSAIIDCNSANIINNDT